jgi:hypothetical protein
MQRGIGSTLEDNQAVANLASKLHQQVKANTGNAGMMMTLISYETDAFEISNAIITNTPPG